MSKKMIWKGLFGQQHVKTMLANAFDNKTLGHAYLFCGDAGAGAFQAALEMSMAVLCTGKVEETPCGECESCIKVMRLSHPDFHLVTPVCLEKEHRGTDGKLSQEGWSFLSDAAKSRLADPYVIPGYASNPSIPVEWIKEVNHAVLRGPVIGGSNIVIIDGIDIMNKESANAMLKTLEEPPPGALFILITSRSNAILPTIASRCQTVRFGSVPPAEIKNVIDARFKDSVSSQVKDAAVRYSMGSPGRAIDLCKNPPGPVIEEACALIEECRIADWPAIFSHIDELARHGDFEQYERLFTYITYLVRSGFLGRIVGSGTYSDDIGDPDKTGNMSLSVDTHTAERCITICREAISGVRAYGNVSIVLVNYMLSLTEILYEQKQ